MPKPPEIENSLMDLRRRRGISAIHLAEAAGVARQTIHAVESGTFVPNTAVALKLARVLNATVEELFSLPDVGEGPARGELAELLPGSEKPRKGQPVELCRVDRRLIASAPPSNGWYLPGADGVVAGPPRQGKTAVQSFRSAAESGSRLLVAGCDPAISVLARHALPAGVELVLAHRNSSQSLALLKSGAVHIAGTHLRDDASGESNLPEITRMFGRASIAVISFAVWEEGIVTAAGNPKRVRGVEDFTRKDIAIVNREKGSGSRHLLDLHLKRLGIAPKRVRGYEKLAPGHLPAAFAVHSGGADCCIATRAAARVCGLGFLPLVSERYDLAIRKRHLALPAVTNLLDTLSRSRFRRELEGWGGYDTRETGRRVV